jgi:hypothetical protein
VAPVGVVGAGGSVLYLHLTDKTLAAGNGVVRVEGAGPFQLGQLAELVGHDRIVVKPVIDLNDRVSVDAYEIPDRIRERVKLMDPVDRFPWGTAETTFRTDLDYIEPYTTAGPPGQTSTENLAPGVTLPSPGQDFRPLVGPATSRPRNGVDQPTRIQVESRAHRHPPHRRGGRRRRLIASAPTRANDVGAAA